MKLEEVVFVDDWKGESNGARERGEIWVVCLDNLEDNTELIKEKISNNEKLMG